MQNRKIYGQNGFLQTVLSNNESLNPRRLKINTKLQIPCQQELLTESDEEYKDKLLESKENTQKVCNYKVQKNETLSSILLKLFSSPHWSRQQWRNFIYKKTSILYELPKYNNKLFSIHKISPNQIIKYPCKTKSLSKKTKVDTQIKTTNTRKIASSIDNASPAKIQTGVSFKKNTLLELSQMPYFHSLEVKDLQNNTKGSFYSNFNYKVTASITRQWLANWNTKFSYQIHYYKFDEPDQTKINNKSGLSHQLAFASQIPGLHALKNLWLYWQLSQLNYVIATSSESIIFDKFFTHHLGLFWQSPTLFSLNDNPIKTQLTVSYSLKKNRQRFSLKRHWKFTISPFLEMQLWDQKMKPYLQFEYEDGETTVSKQNSYIIGLGLNISYEM